MQRENVLKPLLFVTVLDDALAVGKSASLGDGVDVPVLKAFEFRDATTWHGCCVYARVKMFHNTRWVFLGGDTWCFFACKAGLVSRAVVGSGGAR